MESIRRTRSFEGCILLHDFFITVGINIREKDYFEFLHMISKVVTYEIGIIQRTSRNQQWGFRKQSNSGISNTGHNESLLYRTPFIPFDLICPPPPPGVAVDWAAFTQDQCGSVLIGSDPIWHGTEPPCNCKSPNLSTFKVYPFGRTDPERIFQVLCKRKAYPNQFRNSSSRIQYRVNTA